MIWNKLTEKRPLAYITGMFDGKKSDKVLVYDRSRNYHIAEMYEGFLDGSEFCDFYDERDYKIENAKDVNEGMQIIEFNILGET